MSRAVDEVRRVVAAFRADDARADALVALATYALCLALVALGVVGEHTLLPVERVPAWWHAVPLGVGCAAMVVKRRRPLTALGVGAVAALADVAIGGGAAPVVILWDLLFAVQRHARPAARRWVTRAVAVGVAASAAATLAGTGSAQAAVLNAMYAVAVLVTPLWWGANVRQGRELAAAAEQRAELERERAHDLVRLAEVERHEAVQAERTTMARDLHDVIASHLSAIAITSGAALSAPPDARRDRDALTRVREASLASLSEMRSMIRVLRADGTVGEGVELAATPRLAALDDLVAWARGAGLRVTVEDDGVLAAARAGELPAAVDQAAHRIAREALTNALKHGGTEVGLRIGTDAGPDGAELVVEVLDDGRGADPGRPAPVDGPGTGTGLVSMRERAESLGGTFAAGPAGGGWRVRAGLPLPATVRAGA